MAQTWKKYVKDRPSVPGKYFTCRQDGQTSIKEYDGKCFGFYNKDGWHNISDEDVILWREITLPKAPKKIKTYKTILTRTPNILLPNKITIGDIITVEDKEINFMSEPVVTSYWKDLVGRNIHDKFEYEDLKMTLVIGEGKIKALSAWFHNQVIGPNAQPIKLETFHTDSHHDCILYGGMHFMKHNIGSYNEEDSQHLYNVDLQFSITHADKFSGHIKNKYETTHY